MSCLSTSSRALARNSLPGIRNSQPTARCTFCTQTAAAAAAVRRTTTQQARRRPFSSHFLALRQRTTATTTHSFRRRPFTTSPANKSKQPADLSNFRSIVDNPPEIVRSGRQTHGPGLILLALIPLTALGLGTWQVKRLGWKTELIARLEDRILREPLPLPPRIDPDVVVSEFDYRRVYTSGRYRHDMEMLVGPRMRDGEDGYMVVTPLEREREREKGRAGGGRDGEGGTTTTTTTVLVNRGWISKSKRDQRDRPDSVRTGDDGNEGKVVVEGLLREPWKKNMFTPENRPDKGEFYFPDVKQMAELTGSQPVWIEQTMEPNLMQVVDMQSRGIPIGRAPEVNLRNNHAQYIFTWYGLAFATSIMFYMVVKKPPTNISRRVRQNRDWS